MKHVPAALQGHDFALLWSGQTVSLVGDGVFSIALALETLRLSPKAGSLSLVLAARVVPTVLLLLFAGALTDRLSRRAIMLASDVLRGAVVAAIAALAGTGSLRVWLLVLLSALFGVGDAFFVPAFTALVPGILPDELLVQANALTGTSQLLAQALVGPALGGLLVATAGTAWSFAFDAMTFGVSTLCLAALRTPPVPAPAPRSVVGDVREGLRYTRSQPWLWWTILGAGLANFAIFAPTGVLLPLLIRHSLHAGAFALGAVMAAGGLGGVVAAGVLGRYGAPRRRVTTMWSGWMVAALLFAGLGVAANLGETTALYGLAWFCVSVGSFIWTPLMQQLVPDELLAGSPRWIGWCHSASPPWLPGGGGGGGGGGDQDHLHHRRGRGRARRCCPPRSRGPGPGSSAGSRHRSDGAAGSERSR